MAVFLVCEGFRGGLDDRVLDALVVQHNNLGVLIAPAEGDRGLGAIRAYLESQSVGDVAISVQDRNFRTLAIAQPAWADPVGKSFIWQRHEIENYLLHPRVVLELFNDYRAGLAPAWPANLPATQADVSTLLQTLAGPLVEDYAAEVLRYELVQQVNSVGSLSFGPQRPAAPAGAHAPGQAQWLPALQHEAARLRGTCTAAAALPALQPASIAARHSILLAQFQNPVFLATGNYLLDMGGHELLAALSRHLRGLGALAGLNVDVLADELLRVLQPIYQTGTIYQPDDFANLAIILGQY